LHFAGRYQAAVSTVNNDSRNYGSSVQEDGWNRDGSGAFRLDGCRVTSAQTLEGQAAAATDPVVSARVLDAGDRVSAKLVDLDPDMQLASEVWGLSVRLVTADGQDLVRGSFVPAPFVDLWQRCPARRGMGGLGAFYQSTLEHLDWNDVDSSFLDTLRERSPDRLSIKFNVDGFNANPRDGAFTFGRLVGTIGPASPSEPRHFVAARMLRSKAVFAPARLDHRSGLLSVDLGNALPTASPGGPLVRPERELRLAARVDGTWHALARVTADAPDWYEATAGVADVVLTNQDLVAAADGHLGVLDGDEVLLEEAESRRYVRADQLVHRLDPGDEAEVRLTVTDAGRPPAAPVTVQLTLGGVVLGVREPAKGVSFPETVQTDAAGDALIVLRAGDPGGVRADRALDGQVYAVSWSLAGDSPPVHPNPSDVLSVLVWDRYPHVEQPTWYEHVEPIFSQYQRLYPVMARILNLGDYEDVLQHLELVALSCNLPITDPNHMPVTRDLSGAKHAMLARWFESPLLGRRPSVRARRVAVSPGLVATGESAALEPMTAIKSGRREPDA
jgi:hypothetical protein